MAPALSREEHSIAGLFLTMNTQHSTENEPLEGTYRIQKIENECDIRRLQSHKKSEEFKWRALYLFPNQFLWPIL